MAIRFSPKKIRNWDRETMIKKEIYDNAKDRLKAAAKDKLYRFIMADGHVRGAIIHAKDTSMIKEMRANHELGILETYIPGHAYMAAGLMTMNIQDRDRIALKRMLRPSPAVPCECLPRER